MVLAGVIIGFLVLLTMGMPVNFALGLLGMVGLYFFTGGAEALQAAAIVAFSSANNFTLTAIPLFILMGDLIFRVGFGKDLFDCASAWFGRLRGGLGIATIFACGIFSAVSGSSAAACAAMGLLAIPEMERYHYNKRLVFGTVAAGGSLDILIPPSVILIVYGAFAEQSIAKLYLAGFIPGFILSFFFMIVIYVWTRLFPEDAPTVDIRLTLREKLQKTKHSLVFILLMVACLGTIYMGIATPTEAAGLGAAFTALAAFLMRRLTWQALKESILGTVSVTCMVLFLILGGLILSNFLMFQNIPNQIMESAFSLGLSGWKLLLVLYVVYALLGCLIDGLTLIIVTLPIVVPMMKKLGVDLIWFGIVIVMLVELAQLHPPVGMNLFIVRNIGKGKIEDVIIGSAPFIIAIIAALLLVTIFPSIVTYLPRMIRY
jgi:tripartite ATP-independent transporter DctM subunit